MTIHDVAKASGVSITTVSRALNGYPDVSKETRQRVLEVANRLNYRPSAVARSLVMNRTKTVGLVVSDMTKYRLGHYFMYEVVNGIHDGLADLGYDMTLVSTTTARQRLISYLDFCTERRFDGVILMGIRLDDPYMREVVEAPLPSVVLDVPLLSDHCGYVTTDNVYGAKLAVRHLIERGHKRIGMVNGHLQAAVSQDRLRGYREALQETGMVYDEKLVYEGDFTVEGGQATTAAMLRDVPDVTAIFCASDLMAVGVLRFAHEQGIAVPSQLAVMGFDDIDLTEFVRPSLSTIHQDKFGMGEAAARMLVGMLEQGRQPEGRILMPRLVARETT